MKIRGINIDPGKLMTRQEVLDILTEGGSTDRDLAEVRDRHQEEFGTELIWLYPYSEGINLGETIVAVREGFLSLPYNNVDSEDYEIFDLDHVAMLDIDEIESLIEEYKRHSEDLLGAMGDMLRHLQTQN